MKILIVEDDPILSNLIKRCLEEEYKTEQAFDGEEALYYASQEIFDAMILDIMIPQINGFEVLQKLRDKKLDLPILILTAKGSIEDKKIGFKTGADDYLVKPFNQEELLLRIEAMIRRKKGEYSKKNLQLFDLTLNIKQRKLWIKNEEIKLKGKQYDIIEYLLNHQNELITKEQIFDKIWGFTTDTSTNVVEVYISGLRKILKEYEYDRYLKTVKGGGYMITQGEIKNE